MLLVLNLMPLDACDKVFVVGRIGVEVCYWGEMWKVCVVVYICVGFTLCCVEVDVWEMY